MFEPFMRLPVELRAHIWELTIVPRVVPVLSRFNDGVLVPNEYKYEYQYQASNLIYRYSVLPTPSTVHACREARRFVKYQKAFCDGSAPRGVWINFEYDMISHSEEKYLRSGSKRYHPQDEWLIQRMQIRFPLHGRFCGWGDFDRSDAPMLDRYPAFREMQRTFTDGTTETFFYRPGRKYCVLWIVARAKHTVSADPSSGITTIGDWHSNLRDRPFGEVRGRRWQEAIDSEDLDIGDGDIDGDLWGKITNSEQLRRKWEEFVPPSERHVTRLRMASEIQFVSEPDANESQGPPPGRMVTY